MALNTLKCNHLASLGLKGLTAQSASDDVVAKTELEVSPVKLSTATNASSSNISCHSHALTGIDLNLSDVESCSDSFHSTLAPPVKSRRISEIGDHSVNRTTMITCRSSHRDSASIKEDDGDDGPCGCEGVASSSIGPTSGRVFCKDCYQHTKALAYNISKLPSLYVKELAYDFSNLTYLTKA